MYLICDWERDFSVNSWDIRKQAERQTSQKRSVKANRDEKRGKTRKDHARNLITWRKNSFSEWSYTTVLWESKELIPFDIDFFSVFSLKDSIAQEYTIHSCF